MKLWFRITYPSKRLSKCVDEEDAAKGLIFPSIAKIREVSAHVATAVIMQAREEGMATEKTIVDLEEGKIYSHLI